MHAMNDDAGPVDGWIPIGLFDTIIIIWRRMSERYTTTTIRSARMTGILTTMKKLFLVTCVSSARTSSRRLRVRETIKNRTGTMVAGQRRSIDRSFFCPFSHSGVKRDARETVRALDAFARV